MADPTYYDLSVTGAALSTAITKAGTALQSSDIGVSVQGYDANTVKSNSANTFSVEQIISANSSNPALRITQVGAGDCIRIEDSANPDSTPFVIDASGNVGVGSAPLITGVSIYATSQYAPQFLVRAGVSDNTAGYFNFEKARGAGIVQLDDNLGTVVFRGYDGSAYKNCASFGCSVDNTPGTNDMPGRLMFSTTKDGATSPTEAFRVTCTQDLGIGITAPSARVHVVKTTEQLRLGYDATKYLSITVDSAGDALLAPVGALKFGTWSSNSDAAVNGYITIKDAAGNSRKLATIA